MRRIGCRVSLCLCVLVARFRVGIVFFFAGWRMRPAGLFHQRSTGAHHLEKISQSLYTVETETYPSSYTSNQAQTVACCEILVASIAHGALWTTNRFHPRQVRLLAGGTAEAARAAQVHAVSSTGGRTAGPAVPEVTQFTAQFLTRRGPVVSDVVPDFRHMSFDFQLVLLEPRHVQFLSRGTALELTGDVLIVVANNSNPG